MICDLCFCCFSETRFVSPQNNATKTLRDMFIREVKHTSYRKCFGEQDPCLRQTRFLCFHGYYQHPFAVHVTDFTSLGKLNIYSYTKPYPDLWCWCHDWLYNKKYFQIQGSIASMHFHSISDLMFLYEASCFWLSLSSAFHL